MVTHEDACKNISVLHHGKQHQQMVIFVHPHHSVMARNVPCSFRRFFLHNKDICHFGSFLVDSVNLYHNYNIFSHGTGGDQTWLPCGSMLIPATLRGISMPPLFKASNITSIEYLLITIFSVRGCPKPSFSLGG